MGIGHRPIDIEHRPIYIEHRHVDLDIEHVLKSLFQPYVHKEI